MDILEVKEGKIIPYSKKTQTIDVAINKFIVLDDYYILGGGRDGTFCGMRIG